MLLSGHDSENPSISPSPFPFSLLQIFLLFSTWWPFHRVSSYGCPKSAFPLLIPFSIPIRMRFSLLFLCPCPFAHKTLSGNSPPIFILVYTIGCRVLMWSIFGELAERVVVRGSGCRRLTRLGRCASGGTPVRYVQRTIAADRLSFSATMVLDEILASSRPSRTYLRLSCQRQPIPSQMMNTEAEATSPNLS